MSQARQRFFDLRDLWQETIRSYRFQQLSQGVQMFLGTLD
jgi:hypothetical protein